MGALIALLVIVLLSLLAVRLGANALVLSGMSKSAAQFQAASAFFGTGFTTNEAELVVNHPVRRRKSHRALQGRGMGAPVGSHGDERRPVRSARGAGIRSRCETPTGSAGPQLAPCPRREALDGRVAQSLRHLRATSLRTPPGSPFYPLPRGLIRRLRAGSGTSDFPPIDL